MKITGIRCIRVHGILDEPIGIGEDTWLSATDASVDPFKDWRPDGHRNLRLSFLEILTDDGITGLSRSISPEQGRKICGSFASRLIGRDPADVEGIWDESRQLVVGQKEFGNYLLLPIDMALWDIRGKAAGKPVYKLLNGNGRDRLPVYASTVGCSLASRKMRDRAKQLKDEGYPAQKWFFKFAPKDGESGKKENVRLVRELRETLGDGYPVMLDATFGWSEDYTVEMAQAVAEYDPYWLEDPVERKQWDELKRIKESGGVPIATGDGVGCCDTMRQLLDTVPVDVFQPDEGSLGGITPMMRAAEVAKEYGVPFVPHCGVATCMEMGQAAGVAGAIAAEQKQTPREVDVETLQQRLRDTGVRLFDEDLEGIEGVG